MQIALFNIMTLNHEGETGECVIPRQRAMDAQRKLMAVSLLDYRGNH
jgi:hypothetical protein